MGTLHTLRPRHKLIKDFFTWDVETGVKDSKGGKYPNGIQFGNPGQPDRFIFGAIYGYNHERRFTNVQDLANALLESQYKGKYFFAHFAPYDISTTYGSPFKLDPAAVFNGTRFIKATNGNVIFGDSMNILGRLKLAKVGEMIGIEKPDLGDSTMYEKDGLTEGVKHRCVTDCRILWDALFSVFNGAGDIKLTGPSLALSNFRRFHMKRAIEYHPDVTQFFDSYYGGRTEAFKIGPTQAEVIDVNSMYPFIYRNIRFPNPKHFIVEKRIRPERFLNNILPYYEGQAHLEIEHLPDFFGHLPVKHNGKLVFPVGKFSGCWAFPEIRLAVAAGVVKVTGVTRVQYAPAMPSPFESYVDYYYKIKQESKNEFEIDRVKHLLTDLYGKFGQRISEESIYIDDVEKRANFIHEICQKAPHSILRMFGPNRPDAFLITSTSKSFKIPHQIPSFASYITSAARVHLLKQMKVMQPQGVVYCDTDSIFFEINPGFQDSKLLGGWKVESKVVTAIRGLKNYTYFKTAGDDAGVLQNRIKGVPKKAIQDAEGVWHYTNLLNPKEALRRNLPPMSDVPRTKKIKGTYDKRIVLADGNTLPICI